MLQGVRTKDASLELGMCTSMLALSFSTILVVCGLAVDLSRFYLIKSLMQRAVDVTATSTMYDLDRVDVVQSLSRASLTLISNLEEAGIPLDDLDYSIHIVNFHRSETSPGLFDIDLAARYFLDGQYPNGQLVGAYRASEGFNYLTDPWASTSSTPNQITDLPEGSVSFSKSGVSAQMLEPDDTGNLLRFENFDIGGNTWTQLDFAPRKTVSVRLRRRAPAYLLKLIPGVEEFLELEVSALGVPGASAVPERIAIGLMIDMSGSMALEAGEGAGESKITAAKRVAQEFIASMASYEELGLIDFELDVMFFNEGMVEVTQFADGFDPTNAASIISNIDAIDADGATNIGQPLLLMINRFFGPMSASSSFTPADKKYIILLSDGSPNVIMPVEGLPENDPLSDLPMDPCFPDFLTRPINNENTQDTYGWAKSQLRFLVNYLLATDIGVYAVHFDPVGPGVEEAGILKRLANDPTHTAFFESTPRDECRSPAPGEIATGWATEECVCEYYYNIGPERAAGASFWAGDPAALENFYGAVFNAIASGASSPRLIL